MRFLFIRHGEPDYVNDCLTPTGRLQAQAAAERLKAENICEIYSSPLGRAQETAGYTAKALGLDINTLDFMREISWGGDGLPNEGHIWTLSDKMLNEDNFDFFKQDWRLCFSLYLYFGDKCGLSFSPGTVCSCAS